MILKNWWFSVEVHSVKFSWLDLILTRNFMLWKQFAKIFLLRLTRSKLLCWKRKFWWNVIIHSWLVWTTLTKVNNEFSLSCLSSVVESYIKFIEKNKDSMKILSSFMQLNWFWLSAIYMEEILFTEILNLRIFWLIRRAISNLSITV